MTSENRGDGEKTYFIMNREILYDVIIIGGSYAGLSAAMALGRSMRSVLIIDSGKPCNNTSPAAHNLLGYDGCSPALLNSLSREQVLKYPTIMLTEATAVRASGIAGRFNIETEDGQTFISKKLLFATGIYDEMPAIEGFADCWGVSVLHCPYCHGFEIKGEKTAIIASGNSAFEFAEMISHWTNDLCILTNGPSGLDDEQQELLWHKKIVVNESEIVRLEHQQGYLDCIVLRDGTQIAARAAYSRPFMKQQSELPAEMGCEFHSIHIQVDHYQRTSVPGVFAAGDNCSALRSLSNAISAGSIAGAYMNKELVQEQFFKDVRPAMVQA